MRATRQGAQHSRNHWWQAAAIAAAATLLTFAASRSTSFSDFNHWTYDFTVLHAGLSPAPSNIVLVDFDEETFARIQKFPIPRATVAETLTRIAAQKPRVIGMDIFLSEARSPDEDAAMQTALTAAGNVILASQNSGGSLPPVVPLNTFCQPEDPTAASGFCTEGTPGALAYAFINLPMDPDGFIRQSNLFAASATQGKPPSLAFPLMLAQQYSGEAIKSDDARRARFLNHNVYYADQQFKTVLIGSWATEPVTTISAWKVLANQIPQDAFADKLVLMGQSSDAARDRHFTPLFRSAAADGSRLRLSGTEVHAAAIRSLLEGTVVHPSPRTAHWSIVFAVCFLASFALFRLRIALGLAITVVLAALSITLAIILFAHYRVWHPFLATQLALALNLPITLGLQFIQERIISREQYAQRQQLMKLFSSYVDPAVASTIWDRRDELSLFGEQRTATVLFTDIRSFTAMSAGKPPADVLRWLNQYLTAMDEVIRDHGGFLNKFIGDGLMIIFGLPLSQGVREDAIRAMHASLAMLTRVEVLNQQNSGNPDHPPLRIGIGMHTGTLMAGSIGSANRQEYSVIGETVNLASRLESLNKPFHTEILMSQATRDILAATFTGIECLGGTKVAGFEDEVTVYTIHPPTGPAS